MAVVKGWMHSVRADVQVPNGAVKPLKDLLPGAIKIDWQKLAKEESKIKEEFRVRVMDKK